MTAPLVRLLRPLPLFAVMGSILAATTTASAQTPPAGVPARSDESPLPGTAAQRDTVIKSTLTLDKFTRIDILGKLLPVALTKEQIRAILPAIQKSREKEFQIRVLDAAEIAKLDAETTKAVDDAVAKNDVPSVELQNRIQKVTSAIVFRRNVATGEMMELIYDACKKNLDAGQMKVMASTLKPELIAPGMVVDTDEKKIKFFIRYIFLDGLTYDLLTKMAKPA